MKTGRSYLPTESDDVKKIGKALTGLVALGLAAGVALVAGTNLIMGTLFPEIKKEEDDD